MIFCSWMCLLLLDVSIGCVKSFLQNVSLFPFFFFFNHSFWPRRCGFLTFPCISFSCLMASEAVGWLWAWMGSSSDHMIVFAVGSWGFSGGLF